MQKRGRAAVWLTCLGMLGLVVGCKRASAPTVSAPPPSVPAGPVAQGQFDSETGPHAAGKKVFVANGCFRCHTIDGVRGPVGGGPMGGGFGGGGGPPSGGGPGPGGGGPPMAGGPGPGGPGGRMGMTRGPDLGKVGKEPGHTADWFAEHIRNPKAHKSDSKMPPFDGKIKGDELRALSEYLASLKGA
jgi:cytochrome c1